MSDGSIVDAEIESISGTLSEISDRLAILIKQQQFTYLHDAESHSTLRIDRQTGEVSTLRTQTRTIREYGRDPYNESYFVWLKLGGEG